MEKLGKVEGPPLPCSKGRERRRFARFTPKKIGIVVQLMLWYKAQHLYNSLKKGSKIFDLRGIGSMRCLRCGWDTQAFDDAKWYMREFCANCRGHILKQWIVNGMQEAVSVWACEHGQWFWDLHNIQSWDRKSREIFLGKGDPKLITTAEFLDLVHLDDRERLFETTNHAIENHELYIAEYRIYRPTDGQLRWIRVEGSAYYSESGQPTHMMGLQWDVTERPLIFMPE